MIYTKTELGKTALHDRSLGLTPKQRSMFILFDGKRSVAEVLKLTLSIGVTADDLNCLVTLGLLTANKPNVNSDPAALTSPAAVQTVDNQMLEGKSLSLGETTESRAVGNEQAHYSKAYPIAVRLTSNLGLRGFRLNLSVESAADLEALKDLAPKIKEAVGVEKFRELEDALYR